MGRGAQGRRQIPERYRPIRCQHYFQYTSLLNTWHSVGHFVGTPWARMDSPERQASFQHGWLRLPMGLLQIFGVDDDAANPYNDRRNSIAKYRLPYALAANAGATIPKVT